MLEQLGEAPDLPVGDPESLRTLWEVCRIPDYRKTRTGSHAKLLHEIARDLLVDGRISEGRIGARLDGLDRPEGDLETLMARIAYVRTWTYVSHQRRWLEHPETWQQRTREIEDRLSDALHERLRQRFVDAGAMVVRTDPEAEVSIEEGVVRLGGFEVGTLHGLSWRPSTTERSVVRAARRGLIPTALARLERLLACEDHALAVDLGGQIWWEDGVVGRIARGQEPYRPDARAARLELIEVADRERIRVRLQRWMRDRTQKLLAPLGDGKGLDTEALAVWRALRQGLGSCSLRHLPRLDRRSRSHLAARGIHLRGGHAWHPDLLTTDALAWRSTLHGAWTQGPVRLIPGGAPASFPVTQDTPDDWLARVGYRRIRDVAWRVDQQTKGSGRGAAR